MLCQNHNPGAITNAFSLCLLDHFSMVFFVLICTIMMPVSVKALEDEGFNAEYIQHSAVPDLVSVEGNSGSFSYTYPIVVSTGRAGLDASFSLTYTSSDTSPDNQLGHGWSLSLPYIERLAKAGVDRMYETEYFNSSLSGDLVSTGSDTYQAEVARGSFVSYVFSEGSWTAVDARGMTYTFGVTADSQLVDPVNPERIKKWLLSEIVDPNGNTVTYTYTKHLGAVYIDQISYNDVSTVMFEYEDRPDPHVSYAGGFRVETARRLARITLAAAGLEYQTYTIAYSLGDNGNRSLLASIASVGTGDGSQIVSFDYSATADRSWEEVSGWEIPFSLINGRGEIDLGVRLLDVDGDGLTDAIKSRTVALNSDSSPPINDTEVWLNTGEGFATSTTWQVTSPNDAAGFSLGYLESTQSSSNDGGARFADVNADGYTDIIWGRHQQIYLNNKVDGWEHSPVWDFSLFRGFSNGGYGDGGVRIGDINGDGLVDIVKAYYWTKTHFPQYWNHTVLINTGAGWEDKTDAWTIPVGFMSTRQGSAVRFVDINNDTLNDLVVSIETYNDEHYITENKVYLNTGSEFIEESTDFIPRFSYFQTPRIYNTPAQLVDVNSDGILDVYSNYQFVNGVVEDVLFKGVYIGVSDTDFSTVDASWELPIDFYDRVVYKRGNVSIYDNGSRFIDLDGDGMIDILRAGPSLESPQHAHLNEHRVALHQGTLPDLLSTITDSRGGITDIVYQKTSDVRSDSAVSNNADTHFNITVARDVAYVADGNTWTESYHYDSGHYRSVEDDVYDRTFAGFGAVTKTTDLGSEITYYHQGNGDNLPEEVGDSEARIGVPYLVEVFNDNE